MKFSMEIFAIPDSNLCIVESDSPDALASSSCDEPIFFLFILVLSPMISSISLFVYCFSISIILLKYATKLTKRVICYVKYPTKSGPARRAGPFIDFLGFLLPVDWVFRADDGGLRCQSVAIGVPVEEESNFRIFLVNITPRNDNIFK